MKNCEIYAILVFSGGIDKTAQDRTPWHLWTKTSKEYFLGCVFDFLLNGDGEFLDLPRYSRDQVCFQNNKKLNCNPEVFVR